MNLKVNSQKQLVQFYWLFKHVMDDMLKIGLCLNYNNNTVDNKLLKNSGMSNKLYYFLGLGKYFSLSIHGWAF